MKMTEKTRNFLFWTGLVTTISRGKLLNVWKCYVTMTEIRPYKSNNLELWKTFFYLQFQRTVTSFNYQRVMMFTHGLQPYCLFGQSHLHRLYRPWRFSRQIWTLFLVQKELTLIRCKSIVFQRDDKRGFCLFQRSTMGETNFDQFVRLRTQLVLAKENFGC